MRLLKLGVAGCVWLAATACSSQEPGGFVAAPAPSEPTVASERASADSKEARQETQKEAKKEEAAGWGATVFLSNDDSMSLASAQRVLFALSRGLPLDPAQVRPHELLNYFSFDTVT
jgi:hypothetical protein